MVAASSAEASLQIDGSTETKRQRATATPSMRIVKCDCLDVSKIASVDDCDFSQVKSFSDDAGR